MQAGELCVREVVVTTADRSVADAAQLMRVHHVGDVVVVEEESDGRRPVGILTDRDMVLEVLAVDGAASPTTRVEQVMTCELVTAGAREDVSKALERMRAFGVRRMPIVDDQGLLVGILTYDDILEWLAEEMAGLVRVVRAEQRVERERSG